MGLFQQYWLCSIIVLLSSEPDPLCARVWFRDYLYDQLWLYTPSQELLSRLESDWLQEWKHLLLESSLDSPTSSLSSPSSSSFSSPSSLSSPSLPPLPSAVVLVLGPRVQVLPWEGLLADQPVSRMPSLPFMAAHKCMVSTINITTYTPCVYIYTISNPSPPSLSSHTFFSSSSFHPFIFTSSPLSLSLLSSPPLSPCTMCMSSLVPIPSVQ